MIVVPFRSTYFLYKAVRVGCFLYTADVYNALQVTLVFLIDVPKPKDKRKC